jgi:pimeloyl-ACP methyl ester carboxylesterase
MSLFPADLLVRVGHPLSRRRVRVDGLDLAYADTGGPGRPVVLVHGALTVLDDMLCALAPALCGYRLVAFDRPGCGESDARPWIDAGLDRQGRRLSAAIHALGLERPVLVGHSMGASIALSMACRQPAGLAGVVAIAPLVTPELRLEHWLFAPRSVPGAGDLLTRAGSVYGDRALFSALWRAMFLPQSIPDQVLRDFPFALAGRSQAGVRLGEDAIAMGPDLIRLAATAARCPTPVCILGGDRDLVVRNGLNGRLLASLMPNARYLDIPGVGHMAHHFVPGQIRDAVDALSARA